MNHDQKITAVLQIIRLKGRVPAASLATALGITPTQALELLQLLKDSGAITETNGNHRLAPVGKDELAQRIVLERSSVDQPAMQAVYETFHAFNSEFKALVTDWQVNNGVPNRHADAAYDAGIINPLSALDARWKPLLEKMTSLAPRLSAYPARFQTALQNLQASDHSWMARPVLDSYHTVWFELHEDLMGLLGLSREAEASAGRAE